MIGTLIDHYRVESMLGRGGMGEVYRALDTRLDRPVAIKVLPDRAAAAGPAVDRLFREARAASALNHPNIVTIHQVGRTDDGAHFIVQELVEGRTLTTYVREPLPIDTVAAVGAQVARALAVAHAAGIAHRDIKPDNIMLRPDGYVKVLDFGLARQTGEVASLATMTGGDVSAPGLIVGTMPYMSPEQAQGEPAGAASDVFSLGIVLYELATGRRPFVADSSFGVLNGIINEHPIAASHLRPDVPPELDALILSMLSKPSALRPAAADVAASLSALQRVDLVRAAGAVPERPRTVGRQQEHAALRAIFDEVLGGRGQIAAVVGEPGIGKTSVVEEFLGSLVHAGEAAMVLRGKCSERLAGAEAYLPLLEALDDLQQSRTGGSFREMLKTVAPTWYVQVGRLPSDSSSANQIREEVKHASPDRMKRELGQLFSEVSRVRPVVLFFEDLHWADVSTIDLLNYLAGRFDALRVLVIVTYRPADMQLSRHPFLKVRTDLVARGLLREIALSFLDVDAVETYLAREFPGHMFPAGFAGTLHARTEGNPLFLVDLVRYLRDRRVIDDPAGRWTVTRALADVQRELPDSVRGTITRNLERLDETDRKLLLAASVQGHEFDTAIVAEATGFDPADVEEHLDALERVHGLVRAAGPSKFPDEAISVRYRFVHVLYQNVLYGSLQPSRKASLSGKVALALCGRYGDRASELASELALLFETARDHQQAAKFFHAAARRAAGIFAFREADLLARRGLAALGPVPETAERQQLELGLQMLFGLARRSLEGWASPNVEPIYARARQLCQALGDGPRLFPVLWGVTLFHAIRGDLQRFVEMSEELLSMANAQENPVFQMAAHQMAAASREFCGDTVRSSAHFERAIELHDPARHAEYTAVFGLDPGMISRSLSLRPLWFLGYPDKAMRRCVETVALVRQLRQPISLVFAICMKVDLHLQRYETPELLEAVDEQILLCHEYGLAQEMEWGRTVQGVGLARHGDAAGGLELMRDSLAVQDRMHAGLLRPTFLTLLAGVLLEAGRLEEGLDVIERAFAWGERTGEVYYRAETWRTKGDLLRGLGRLDEAEAALDEAARIAAAQRALSIELRVARSRARLLAERGRRVEARDVLAPVLARFDEGGETGDLRVARVLLDELGT